VSVCPCDPPIVFSIYLCGSLSGLPLQCALPRLSLSPLNPPKRYCLPLSPTMIIHLPTPTAFILSGDPPITHPIIPSHRPLRTPYATHLVVPPLHPHCTPAPAYVSYAAAKRSCVLVDQLENIYGIVSAQETCKAALSTGAQAGKRGAAFEADMVEDLQLMHAVSRLGHTTSRMGSTRVNAALRRARELPMTSHHRDCEGGVDGSGMRIEQGNGKCAACRVASVLAELASAQNAAAALPWSSASVGGHYDGDDGNGADKDSKRSSQSTGPNDPHESGPSLPELGGGGAAGEVVGDLEWRWYHDSIVHSREIGSLCADEIDTSGGTGGGGERTQHQPPPSLSRKSGDGDACMAEGHVATGDELAAALLYRRLRATGTVDTLNCSKRKGGVTDTVEGERKGRRKGKGERRGIRKGDRGDDQAKCSPSHHPSWVRVCEELGLPCWQLLCNTVLGTPVEAKNARGGEVSACMHGTSL
jgi:hypothetical protein